MKEKNQYFPIFINLENKHCIVYGGGTIASRRVTSLLRFGARVTVYAEKINETIQQLVSEYPETLTLRQQPYQAGNRDADFVFSCVDNRQVDLEIHRECREHHIPVNIASDQSLCDFYFPALVVADELVIGISSGGKNHKKVKEMAQKLRNWIGGMEWNKSE